MTEPDVVPPDAPAYRVAAGADIADSATIGDRSSVWHLAQVREDARIGADCVVGRGAYIGSGVEMGNGCKIQNYALVYEPAKLADGVFVGPAAVFTNDHFPRAVNPDLTVKSASDWEPVGVTCETGASIGARAVCVAPVTIGAWAMVAAGATVVKDVPPHALVAGVPARHLGWVGRSGEKLVAASDSTDAWVCPTTGERYTPDDSTGGLLLASSPLTDAPRSSDHDEQDGSAA
ncbi:MAG: acyltransferase [Actinomycetota bacterium]